MRHKRWWAFVLSVPAWMASLSSGSAPDQGEAPPQTQPAPATQPQAQATEAAAPASPTAPAPAPAPEAPTPAPLSIQFNFKGATFDQVLDYFSRITGLPVVKETDVPEGTLDYLSPKSYELPEALRVLNMLLQTKGVMLRVTRDNLFLQKLDQMQKEDIPTFIGTIPEQVTPDQIITVVYPLKISLAKPLAEKLASMVAAYGSVAALEQQNSLIITETAANVRRIISIIETLDREDPEGVVEIFKINHAKAKDLMVSLTALLATKVEKFVVNEKGQQIKIEESQMPGLQISPDERTNSIIAKGVQNRVDKLRQTIQLLDVPAAGNQGRSMTTMALTRITPAEAAAKLNALFARLEEKARPTVLALDDASKVMLIGDEEPVREGSMLIAELEGGPVRANGQEPVLAVVRLERAQPAAAATALAGLLSKPQQAAVRIVPGPDGKSLIVAGLPADVDAVRAIVPLLDQQMEADRQVRLVRVVAGDPAAILEQARKLYHQQIKPDDQQAQISAEVNAESRVITLVGSAKALDAVTGILRQIEGTIVVDREARRIALAHRLPSELVGPLTALATPLLQPRDGAPFNPPSFTPIDQLKTLVVSATPQQLAVIEPLVASLDEAGGDRSVRLLTIENADAAQLAVNLDAMFAGAAEPRPTIRVDGPSNSLLVRATQEQFETIEQLTSQIDKATLASSRQVRLVPIDASKASAAEIAETLRKMLERAGSGAKVQVISLEELIKSREATKPLSLRQGASTDDTDRAAELQSCRAAEFSSVPSVKSVDALGALRSVIAILALAATPQDEPEVTIAVDPATNSLIILGSQRAIERISGLLRQIQDQLPAAPGTIRYIEMPHDVDATTVGNLVNQTIEKIAPAGGAVGDLRKRVAVIVDAQANALIVAANDVDFQVIADLLAAVSKPSKPDAFPIRTIILERAEAAAVAAGIQQFFTDRAKLMRKPGPAGATGALSSGVALTAIESSNTLLVSASDEDFREVETLVKQFDTAEAAAGLTFRVFQLKHAKAPEIERTVQSLVDDLIWNQGDSSSMFFWWPPMRQQQSTKKDTIAVRADARLNSLIVTGRGDKFAVIEQVIEILDAPPPEGEQKVVRLYRLDRAQPQIVADVIRDVFNQGRQRRPWEPPDPNEIRVRIDEASSAVLVSATGREHEDIKSLVEGIDAQLASQEGSGGLAVRFVKLNAAAAARIASLLNEAYQPKAQQTRQPLMIRADPHSNNLIVASTGALFEDIKSSAAQLDGMAPAPGQAIFIIDLQNIPPDAAKSVIETIGLDKPQPAESVSRIVSEPVKVSLLPGRNAIVVIASPADRETVVGLLKAIDADPPHSEAQTRIVKLRHAQAAALAQILNQVLRPGEQQAETPLARAIKEQVRRLSVHKDAANGESGGGRVSLDLTKPVRVVADPALNALIVSSTYENIAALEEVIAMLDQLPITEAVTVQLFPLQNISAEQFSRILREIFAQGKQLGRTTITKVAGLPEGAVGKALLEDVALSIDERTNTVIVAGTEDSVALVEVLAKRIDSDVAAAWVEPKVLPLRYADAGDLAATLQAIIVEGATNLPQSTPLQRQIGRLRMARARPNGEVGGVIESDVFQPMTKLIIRPEPQMNALILVGTPANIEVVSELVAMLDIEASSPSNAVRIYPVENASASRLAQTIRQIFDQQVASKAIRPEDRVIVQSDDRTNALVVATSPRSFAVLEGLLKTLDSKLSPELREIRTIEVKNASATRLATLIQQMMDARLERLRRVQPETADLERAVIVADGRTNNLVVAAGNDTFEVIKRLAADLDTSALGDASLLTVLPVPGGNIDRVASAINQIMQRRYADMPADLRNSLRPLVLTDPRTNSLLVAANPEDMKAIEDLVGKLSAAPENPAVGIHVIPMGPGVRAELVAPRVQRIMTDRQQSLGPAGTPSDRVTIEPDLASNSLIVAANDENLAIVRGLIEALVQADAANARDGGTEAAGGREVELVMLSSASRAADVVDMLEDLYVTEANRTRGQNTVRITADERVNGILINAPASDLRALKNLIAQLDGARPASVVEIKYIPLVSANALETVSLIENVLSGRGIGARRGTRQATVLKYLREIAKTQGGPAANQPVDVEPEPEPAVEPPVEMEVSAAIRESITLTPDLRTNTIIVSAPRESMKMIEQMIRDLDQSTTGAKNIRVFKLVNADAVAMAQIITDLFNLKQGSSLYVLKPREDQAIPTSLAPSPPIAGGAAPGEAGGLQSPGAVPLGGIGGTELTAVPDERQALSITVDSRTNSLIVSGTPTYLDLVEKVVNELDQLEANEREVFVYQLRNAVAAEVAKVIGEFVDQEQKKLISTLSVDQLGSAARLLEREITIQGDEKSNTVLVSASPRYMDRVKEMIRQLDVDPPQVLIQVMLAEVTLDSRDEWGVDLLVGGEVGGADVSAGFGLATAFVPGLGVPNLAIAASDFDLLIRAMKSQGRLQVLSNPSIMAANNAPARIQVGETIRLPAVTTVSDSGQVSSAVEKEDIGVILEVTPSINPDGFVRMVITPEISNLSARTTQISEEFESPIITRRTADTTVTVHDGQTIVIGGLISDRFERRDRMVPLLGELPIIGALFRSNTEETAKTELLIVLTPHVIESPTNFERVDFITDQEIDRLTVPEDVKANIRRGIVEGTGGLFDSSGRKIELKEEEQE